MAIQPLYPSSRPTLNLHFAKVKALDPRITFARASGAAYYDGKTVAKAEENLLIRSQEFDIIWTKTSVTVTDNNSVAPDGTTTASLLEASSSTIRIGLNRGFAAISGVDYAISFFAKAGTHDIVQLAGLAGSFLGNGQANFDLTNGVLGTVSGGTATITNVGNSWYRCTWVVTTAQTAPNFYITLINSTATGRFDSAGIQLGDNVELWGAQLEQRSSVTAYTATTNQPITQFQPVLLSESANVARFDHDPITGESLGLLIEEQRTNLLLRSEEFDDAGWTKARSSIESNTVVAPDGTLTGDKLIEDTTASATHVALQGVSVTSGVSYSVSVFAKASERTSFSLQLQSGTFGAPVTGSFNLSTGVATLAISGTSSSVSITPVGNGWFRCSLTSQATTSGFANTFIFIENTPNNRVYTGDGYSGIFIWGASLEQAAFPTSYIPTTTAQVTRAADAASMTGANFSSWYRQDEWTMYSEYSTPHAGAITGSGASSYIWGFVNPNETSFNGYGARIRRNTSSQPDIVGRSGATVVSVGAAYELVVPEKAYRNVGFIDQTVIGNCVDGRTVATNTNTVFSLTNPSELRIGEANTGGLAPFFLNGHIRKISYYPQRLANVQLQSLTK